MSNTTTDESKLILEFFLRQEEQHKQKDFSAFLEHYRNETSLISSFNDPFSSKPPIFQSSADIRKIVGELRSNPAWNRSDLESSICHGRQILHEDVEHGVRYLLRVGFMLDMVLDKRYANMAWTRNYVPQHWNEQLSFEQFVKSSVPRQKEASMITQHERGAIAAWKLKKRCKIRIQRTDNIADHLLYEPGTRTLKVFHQMAYLRAHLACYPRPVPDVNLEDSLKQGSLTPQLLLETLVSFYAVLFPIVMDPKRRSKRLLDRLIAKKGFDPEVGKDIESHAPWIPNNFQFHYWGERLKGLVELAKKPPVTSSWMSWMDRHTKERNALIIAIVGLFLSALFGLLGFLVGVAQLAVAVEAWKTANVALPSS